MTASRFRFFHIMSARARTSSSSSSSSTTSSPSSTTNKNNTNRDGNNDNNGNNGNNGNKKRAKKSNSFRFKTATDPIDNINNDDVGLNLDGDSDGNNGNHNESNHAQPETKMTTSAIGTHSINHTATEESNSSSNRQRSSTYPSRTRPSSSFGSGSAYSSALSPPRYRARTNSQTRSQTLRRLSPSPPPKNRVRLNSREIPRTYSGLYGIGGGQELTHHTQTPSSDLLPFELSRNCNTNWLYSYPNADLHHNNTNYLRNNIMASSLLWIYIFFIVFVEFALLVLPIPILKYHVNLSFTITNIMHGIITIIFLHWLKGSPNFYDHGELNAMTLWEQLSCSPESNLLASQTKQVLYVIPTILCYVSCRMVDFDLVVSVMNLSVWGICIVAKMEGMHGVRLFGLNRTIGIDDDVRKSK